MSFEHGTIVITTDGQTYDINLKQPYQYVPQKLPKEESSDVKETDSSSQDSGKYVGSKNSDRYHYPDCRHAKNILPKNEVWFGSVKEAKEAGYVPCGGCKPPQ